MPPEDRAAFFIEAMLRELSLLPLFPQSGSERHGPPFPPMW